MKNTLTAIALGTMGIVTFIQSNDSNSFKNFNKKIIHKDSIKVWALDSQGNTIDSGFLNQSNEFTFPHLKPGVYNVKTKNFKTKEVYAYQSIDIAYPNKLMKLNAQFKNIAKRIVPTNKVVTDTASIKGELIYSWDFGDKTSEKMIRTKDFFNFYPKKINPQLNQ